MKKFITTALLMIILVTACSKKDKTASKSELLTSGTWKLSAAEEDNDGNGTYEIDNYAFFSDCFKDNYFTFQTNGILEMNEGPTKCDPADPQTETGNWQLTQNETHIKVDADEWILEELTNTTLRWKEVYGGGRSSRVTFTKR